MLFRQHLHHDLLHGAAALYRIAARPVQLPGKEDGKDPVEEREKQIRNHKKTRGT